MKVGHAYHETDDGREYALVAVNGEGETLNWSVEIRSDQFDTIALPCKDKYWAWHVFDTLIQALVTPGKSR